MKIGKVAVSAVMVIATSFVSAQEKIPAPTKESCRAFVAEFYGWYVPKARDVNTDSLKLVLKQRRSAFSPRLVKGVEAVEADAARNQDAGLDFDWILNSQDPGGAADPGYLVQDGRLSGKVCRVEVLPSDRKGERIVPELEFENGRWLFVNFHYPNSQYPQNENLVSLIRAYLNTTKSPKPH